MPMKLVRKNLNNSITKGILFSLLLFSLGFLHYTIAYKNNPFSKTEFSSKNIGLFRTEKYEEHGAIDIFLNNMRVGFLISIVGFATGGILTVLILYWNGFLIANTFFTAIDFIPIRTIFYYLKHAPLEIFALTLFSVIGFKGFFFYKKIFLKEDNLNIVIPKPKDFLLPTILLFIASFIEIL